MIATVAPTGRKTRISPDSAWPLRRAEGNPFYEPRITAASPTHPAGAQPVARIEAMRGAKGGAQ